MSTDSKPHSELVETILAMPVDHQWAWKDLNDHVAQTEHAPGCLRCVGEEALRSLIEQLETAREERDLFYDRLQESREQLEAVRGPLEQIAKLHPSDTDQAPHIARRTLERMASSPASEPSK